MKTDHPSDRTSPIPVTNFRLTDETKRQIAEIAEAQHGLKATAVVTWAVEELHARVVRPPSTPRTSRQRKGTTT
jgi:hypothetical protein